MPQDLLAVVHKAMARDAGARYPSARELADDLRRFQTGQIVAAHSDSRAERFRRFVRRDRTAAAASITAFVMLAALAGVGLYQDTGSPRGAGTWTR